LLVFAQVEQEPEVGGGVRAKLSIGVMLKLAVAKKLGRVEPRIPCALVVRLLGRRWSICAA